MKIKSIAILGLVATVAFTSCNKQSRQDSLASELDSVSYALGLDMANKIKLNFPNANGTAFIDGYEDAADTSSVKVKSSSIDGILRAFFMKKQQEAMAKAADSTASQETEKVNNNTSSELLSEYDTVSYALGLDMALKMKPNFEEINDPLFVQGYRDFDQENVLLEIKDLDNILRTFFMERQQKKAEEQAMKEFGAVKEEGIKFLEENKSKEGVVVLESGLQYKVVKEGNDTKPSATDNVTVHYHGTTPDGTVFDSSVDRGEPASFGLNQVIKGWTEGLQLMGEGAKYTFYIPQELAYGANPRGGGPIKPFMPLVFEVELIKVNK
ncbi:FKBP-type peptidyl-prolyl cis-trans isomerase [Flavicella marina]|uniref:FKBP-type peptidyl-prolyl cis-trans isomerase n=1 Tax=Flavicella marina TaxID=1475951 RepID=UPI0012657B91|nr:FKBP-type peptidyl-prolyl cis-trans isomerase [Flavicella marina]